MVGACIRRLRLQCEVPLDELAQRATMSVMRITGIEMGTCDCSLASLFRIAWGLHMRPSDIIRSIHDACDC